jgi:hypothetical protein
MTGSAPAQNVLDFNETFQSGATFSGELTFTADWSSLTAVNGLLSGGGYGSDPISWIWEPGVNFAAAYGYGPYYGGNFLMDGSSLSYTYFVTITWDYQSAPALTLVGTYVYSVGFGNNVNYTDLGVGGGFSPVPDGGLTLAMLGMATGGLAWMRRKL